MRISDWSSDVCSSDLTLLPASVRRGKAPETGAAPADPMAVFGEYQQFARDFMSSEGLDEVDPIAAMSAAAGAESEGGPPMFSKELFEAMMEVVIEEKGSVYAVGLGSPEPGMDKTEGRRIGEGGVRRV